MQLVVARNLRQFGHLDECRAVPCGSESWYLEVKAYGSRGGEVAILEAQRGHLREFKTLDAAFHAAQKIGFHCMTVCSDRMTGPDPAG